MRHILLKPLLGKPVVAYKDRKRREIGIITAATLYDGALTMRIRITDEELMHDYVRPFDFKDMTIGG